MTTLERTNLIIIDDWGPQPLTADQRRDLLEIVDDRYDKGSLLITSQVPVSQWHDVIADPTLGDAILDRIIHNALAYREAAEILFTLDSNLRTQDRMLIATNVCE